MVVPFAVAVAVVVVPDTTVQPPVECNFVAVDKPAAVGTSPAVDSFVVAAAVVAASKYSLAVVVERTLVVVC